MGLEMFSLDGKVALVTGASRGIGAAFATAFAEAGADVALAARSTADIEALAGKIQALGRRAIAITTDVTDSAQVDASVERAIAELGRIDVLVNNAGGSKFMSGLVDTREEGWHKGIRLNLDSVFYYCKAAGKHMVERGSGSVINVSSVAGLTSAPGLAFYSAAKHGVIGITKTLASEWGTSGVRCNAICPGWIMTDLNKAFWGNQDTSKEFVRNVPMARWGSTEELTGAAIWLASDASSYVSGASIVIDGGLTVSSFH